MNAFVDLHIHIGRTESGRPVKITGARNLTFRNIAITAHRLKGLDAIGIIDAHVPEVQAEIKALIDDGTIREAPGGGLMMGSTLVILGSEIEVKGTATGLAHVLLFLPDLGTAKALTEWLRPRLKNVSLSTQRLYEEVPVLQEWTLQQGGLFIPAHIFTPFKSLYGSSVNRLADLLEPAKVHAVELGLSSDTAMAAGISELNPYPFLSNSDAHSLANIAREYQAIRLDELSFSGLEKAIRQGHVVANYGLDPKLGKYHRTFCNTCQSVVETVDQNRCPLCGQAGKLTKGVYERLLELTDQQGSTKTRPPYIHHVPLKMIPGIGQATINRLLQKYTEMDVIHRLSEAELFALLPEKIVRTLLKAREGKLTIASGGGGLYGKII
jgi:uncharacterized protein (TIGR00375 family)